MGTDDGGGPGLGARGAADAAGERGPRLDAGDGGGRAGDRPAAPLVAGRFDARWFGLFLAEFAAAYPGERVILVVDNAGWHRARDLRVPPNVILWFLPPHCPEANPVEQVWQWLRDHHTRGERFRTRAAA